MATLTGQTVAASYEQLLHVDRDGGGNSTTHVSVKDGDNGTTFGFTIATDALMMSSTNRLEFGDTGTYINQSGDGILNITSDTEVEINATTIDINGAVAMDGAITGGTNITISGELDAATLDISGNADIDGITNLDNTDIDGTLVVDGSNISLDSTSTLNIDNSNTSNGITIGTATSGVPISIGHTTSETTVNDNLTVTGDLTVNGTTTTINSTTLQIDDKLIELAHSPSGSEGADSAVDGGGIILKSSDSDKSILWENDDDSWHYNQGLVIGSAGSGHDVVFHSGTSGDNFTWDASEEKLTITGTNGQTALDVADGNLVVADNIDLEGDIDVNGTANLDIVDIDGTFTQDAGNVVFNEDSGDYDFRVESNGNANMLFVDGGNDRVGIGTNAPDTTLELTGVTTTGPILRLSSTPDGSTQTVGAIEFFDLSNPENIGAKIDAYTFGASYADDLRFWTNADTTAGTATVKMTINSAGNVGIGDTDPSEAKLSITGVQSGDHALQIDQDQNYTAINIDSEATGYSSIYFDAPKQEDGRIIAMDSVDAITTGSAITIDAGGTTMATTHAGGLVEIMYDGAGTSNNNLLFLKNNATQAVNTIPLYIDQNAQDPSIWIDSESTSHVLNINTPKTTDGQVIIVDSADDLTDGGIAYLYSNSDSNNARNLVAIYNDHASADNAVGLYIKQDGDDACIEFAGAGGGGIKFQASAMASSDANTLDDYEEGTWTGVISDGSNPMTMNGSYTTGNYTKVGNLVTVSGFFITTALGSASGDIRLTGLPFTIANAAAANISGAVGYGGGFAITAGTNVSFYSTVNTTYVNLTTWDATTGGSHMQESEWTADGAMMIGFSYTAA